MRSLNRLNPDYHKDFMREGFGQPVNYLFLESKAALQTLEEDVKSGASQFKEVLGLAEQNPSRAVVISCDEEETGLMAVSYLANAYNEKEGYIPDSEELKWWRHEHRINKSHCEHQNDETTDAVENSTDTDDIADSFENECESAEYDEDASANNDYFQENPYIVPVIHDYELSRLEDMNTDICMDDMIFSAHQRYKNQMPYWVKAVEESVCVVTSLAALVSSDSYGSAGLKIEMLKRFQGNRHLYLVIVNEDLKGGSDSEPDGKAYNNMADALGGIVFKLCAPLALVKKTEDDYKKYRKILFDSWIAKKGYTLQKVFPYKKVLERIEDLCMNASYSRLEKIIGYVIDNKDTNSRKLTAEDFDVLEKFRMLGHAWKDRDNDRMKNMDQELYGMEEVKKQIASILSIMKYQKFRKESGFKTDDYHKVFMFLGAPGTAKTSMANLLGDMMYHEKLLPGCNFTSVNGAELKAEFLGQTVSKVHQLFEDHDVIFIDEAYSIAADDGTGPDSYSQEAVAQLLIEIEKNSDKKLIIFAGYGGTDTDDKSNCMTRFLNMNPGIRSRITGTILFPSYQAKEMVHIFEKLAEQQLLFVPDEVKPEMESFFAERRKKSDFGNGREARNLLEHAMKHMASRVMKEEVITVRDEELDKFDVQDIRMAMEEMKQAFRIQSGYQSNTAGFAEVNR